MHNNIVRHDGLSANNEMTRQFIKKIERNEVLHIRLNDIHVQV